MWPKLVSQVGDCFTGGAQNHENYDSRKVAEFLGLGRNFFSQNSVKFSGEDLAAVKSKVLALQGVIFSMQQLSLVRIKLILSSDKIFFSLHCPFK